MQSLFFQIGEKKILTVMAVAAEYGDCLKKTGINPYFIGVGPIQAAIKITKILSQLQSENNLPDFIFNIGSAGSQKLLQTELYQASIVTYRDIDVTPFGFAKGETPFVEHSIKLQPAAFIENIPFASLSTGGDVITCEGKSGRSFADLEEDMVDMESYSVLSAAFEFKIPTLILRGISDGQDEIQGKMDWEQYLHKIDEKLAKIYQDLSENPSWLRFKNVQEN